MPRLPVLLPLALLVASTVPSVPGPEVTPDVTIALFGDQGSGSNSDAVLALVRDEGADAVIHLGDFDYQDNPAAWNAKIDAFLGPEFPYFAAVGNHDKLRFYGPGGY